MVTGQDCYTPCRKLRSDHWPTRKRDFDEALFEALGFPGKRRREFLYHARFTATPGPHLRCDAS